MKHFEKYNEYKSWVKKYFMVARLRNKRLHVGWNRPYGAEEINIGTIVMRPKK